jgi:purine-nucleoside phosphorylase
MTVEFLRTVQKAADSVRNKYKDRLHTAVILGSGLGDAVKAENAVSIPYASITGFPVVRVAGHAGILKLAAGKAFMLGRFHYFEGHSLEQIMLPVFMLQSLGVTRLIVTNAAGSLCRRLKPGDIVLIRDQLNLLGVSPLRVAETGSVGPRFVNMEHAYSERLVRAAKKICPGIRKQGVYVCVPGPQYETPAEAKMLRILGGDMVGMSTVPEVIAARFLGLEVLGFSCITNYAPGMGTHPVKHENVLKVSETMTEKLCEILEKITSHLEKEQDDR